MESKDNRNWYTINFKTVRSSVFQMRRCSASCCGPIRSQLVVTQPIRTHIVKTRPNANQLVILLSLIVVAMVQAVGTERRFYPSHKTEKEAIAVKESRLISNTSEKWDDNLKWQSYVIWKHFYNRSCVCTPTAAHPIFIVCTFSNEIFWFSVLISTFIVCHHILAVLPSAAFLFSINWRILPAASYSSSGKYS
jgi:hypothetical protein